MGLDGSNFVFLGETQNWIRIHVALGKRFFEASGLLSLGDHWKDAKGASVSLLGLADPSGSKGSCSLL